MTARRLRAVRRSPQFPDDEAVRFAEQFVVAPGHFDGDGCVFPAPDHLILSDTPTERKR